MQVDKLLKHKQLAVKIEREILAGRFSPGQPLPSIRSLMATDKLSKGTIVKSLKLLNQQGLVACHPQRGFFVIDRNRPDPGVLQIAFAAPSLTGDVLPLIREINQSLSTHTHITQAVYTTQTDLHQYKRLLEKIHQFRPAGVILVAVDPEVLPIDLENLSNSQIPTVILGGPMNQIACDRIYQSAEDLMRLAVRHLIQRKARRLALIVDQPDKHNKSQEVITTIREELTLAGLSLPNESVFFIKATKTPGDPFNEARQKMRQILTRGVSFDAVVTQSDSCALGALQACYETELSIPDDVKILSLTHQTFEGFNPIKLTTIDTRPQERARAATNLLLRRIEGFDGPPEIHHISGELIPGQTT